MMRHLLLIIIITFSIKSFAISDEEINAALNYIHKTSIMDGAVSIDNIERLSATTALITNYLLSMKPDIKIEAVLKEYRLRGLETLNFIRFNNDKYVYPDELEFILSDYEFLKLHLNKKQLSNIEYLVGRVFLHLVDDKRNAYVIWEKCGYSGHAGCMNILASAYFSGIEGVEQSIEKSIHWHKNVIKTGIDFNCSGIFSAIKLQTLAYSFPQKFEPNDWLALNKEKIRLERLIKKRVESNQSCYGNMAKLSEYMHGKSLGYFSQEKLNELKSSFDVPQFLSVAVLFNDSFNRADVIRVLSPFSEDAYCDVSLLILEYLKRHKKDVFDEVNREIEDKIYQFECEFHKTLISLKQTQGQW